MNLNDQMQRKKVQRIEIYTHKNTTTTPMSIKKKLIKKIKTNCWLFTNLIAQNEILTIQCVWYEKCVYECSDRYDNCSCGTQLNQLVSCCDHLKCLNCTDTNFSN